MTIANSMSKLNIRDLLRCDTKGSDAPSVDKYIVNLGVLKVGSSMSDLDKETA